MNNYRDGYKDTLDSALVEMTLLGNTNAYEELVSRHQKSVHGTAFKVTGNRYSAEDASQDAFVSAWMKLDSLRERDKFGSWVCTIAKNCARSIVTHYSCAAAEISLDLLRYSADNEDEDNELQNALNLPFYNEQEQKDKLHEAVESLNLKIRETLKLHYFEELSVAEIAEKLSLPVGTVKWRLSEGRRLLRKEYGVMDKTYDENETVVQRVMRQVEQLKMWSRKNDTTGFEAEYRRVLADVESLKDSKDKSHALADVLLHGSWWIEGERNDEVYERIKKEAIAGHNDDVMQSVVSRDAHELEGNERLEFMLKNQVPFLEKRGFKKSLGYTWFWAGWLYSNKADRDTAIQCYNKVLEVLSPCDVYYANALSAIKAEEFRKTIEIENRNTKLTNRKRTSRYRGGATGEVYKWVNGQLLLWSQPGYSFGSSDVQGESIFWNMSQSDSVIYDTNMSLGDVYTSSDGLCTLTYKENGIKVKTPAGIFENCELWIHNGTRYGLDSCETYICPGIGIVKQDTVRFGVFNTWLLNSYNIIGGNGVIPFEKGNRWDYVCETDNGIEYKTNSYFEVISFEKETAVVSAGHLSLLKRYNTETWNGAMSYLTNAYSETDDDGNEIMTDVRGFTKEVKKLASTKREKLLTDIASDVMCRIQNCYPHINPDYKEKGKWNFFTVYDMRESNGKKFFRAHRRASKFNFMWKANMWNIGNEGYKVLYGNFLHEIKDAVGCVWSEKWIPGYHTEAKSHAQDGAKYVLDVLDDETVETPCGVFENCRHVTYELSGMVRSGTQFQGGKKDIWYANGVGIVKFRTDYWYDRTLTCDWELKEYREKGEGYFPVLDSAYRKYAPTTIGDGWHASVEHTYDTDENGTIIIFNVLGTRDRKDYEADDENKDKLYD